VREARQNGLYDDYVSPLVEEAKLLGLSKQEIIAVILREW
jgi:DNA-binding transcriptional regulator YhcF (GntR family)